MAITLCCLWYVLDTILSAIHNCCHYLQTGKRLFMICVRYDFVSYSQHMGWGVGLPSCCLWYVLDTILSAIHNMLSDRMLLLVLFMICVRYDFVSYSQPDDCLHSSVWGCLWYVLDTILSAIHNEPCCTPKHLLLFMICVRYDFVSYSQQADDRREWHRVVYDMC